MVQAKQATLEGYRQHANNVTPPLSRAFGAAVENFNNSAVKALDSTRVVVDSLTSMTRTVIITATIVGLLILLFTDRYLVALLVKPLERIRQQFRQIAQGDLSQPIEPIGRNCVGQLVPLLSAMQDSLREAVSTIRSGSENIWRGATEISSGNNDLFAYRRAGRCAGRDRGQHGAAYRNGEAERRKRAPGQPACGCRLQYGQPRRVAGRRCGHDHERHFGQLEENC